MWQIDQNWPRELVGMIAWRPIPYTRRCCNSGETGQFISVNANIQTFAEIYGLILNVDDYSWIVLTAFLWYNLVVPGHEPRSSWWRVKRQFLLRPRQNGRHFADDLFKCISLNEDVCISIKLSLKFVPKGSINNIAALVQIMAWRRPGDKLLSEPVMVRLLTHIYVTRSQCVKWGHFRAQWGQRAMSLTFKQTIRLWTAEY